MSDKNVKNTRRNAFTPQSKYGFNVVEITKHKLLNNFL
jgi:hypothetical protein